MHVYFLEILSVIFLSDLVDFRRSRPWLFFGIALHLQQNEVLLSVAYTALHVISVWVGV